MPFRCRFAALLAVLLPLTAARADILFQSNQVSPLTWPWPAAVYQDDFMFAFRGVVWADPTAVRYSFTEGGSTVYAETVVGAANVGPIAAVCDPTGDLHACFQAQIGDYGLRYAHRPLGGSWSSEWVATGSAVGQSCAVAWRQGLGPVIAWIDATLPYARVLRYGWGTSPGWFSVQLDNQAPGDPLFTGVTMASYDGAEAHLAWTTGREVRYCQPLVTANEVVTAGTSVSSLSLAVGRDGVPRLAILDDGRLRYAERTGSGWTVEPVLPQRTSVRGMSMAVGYEGVPHIVFVTDDPEQPVLLATLFLGAWREQPLTDSPTYGLVQRPSICGTSGALPYAHLAVAWCGDGLQVSGDATGLPAFAVARLRAAPLGDLVSTIDLYSTTQYPLEGWPLILDFTAPGVMDTVNFCYSWRDTLRRWTGTDGVATFRLATGGAVTGGIALHAGVGGFGETVLVERSLPLAGVDLEGNGSVTPVDRVLFDALLGSGDPRADLDFDGQVDAADRQMLLDRIGQACTLSGVDDRGDGFDAGRPGLALHPNPASGAATIRWRLPAAARVRLTVHDLAGRRVRELVVADVPEGVRETMWDGRDERGRPAPAGVYLVRLRTDRDEVLRRLVRLR